MINIQTPSISGGTTNSAGGVLPHHLLGSTTATGTGANQQYQPPVLRHIKEPLLDRVKLTSDNPQSKIILFDKPECRLRNPEQFLWNYMGVAVFSPNPENERRFWFSGEVIMKIGNNYRIRLPLIGFNLRLEGQGDERKIEEDIQKMFLGLPRYKSVTTIKNQELLLTSSYPIIGELNILTDLQKT